MNGKIKNFMEYISSDETLKAELKATLESAVKDGQASAIIQFGKKHGFELTEEDFASATEDLSDGELEAVVGGGGCGCPVAGYGAGDDDGLFCACGVIGSGGVDGSYTPSSQGGCVCVVGGAGATRRH